MALPTCLIQRPRHEGGIPFLACYMFRLLMIAMKEPHSGETAAGNLSL